MAGISITVELHGAEARDRFQDLLDRIDNRQPLFASIGNRVLTSIGQNFRAEKGPDGKPWTPLRPSTVKGRMRKGQMPLTILRSNTKGKSGSPLAGSWNFVADNNQVAVGSTDETAAIHQLGGTINKPARSGRIYRMKEKDGTVGRRFAAKDKANHITEVTIPAHTVTIPARPMVGISASDEIGILEETESWLLR